MKILVTGANGQLGTSLKNTSGNYPEHEFMFTDVDELDICNPHALKEAFLEIGPEMLINCASYNAVDLAEDHPSDAIRINARAVQDLAGLAKKHGSGMVHVSTDYIFDGRKAIAYTELDDPNPLSKYAHSKMIGEQAVMTASPNAAIIRTSWLYSEYGHNFVKTIRKIAAERDEINVVNDQVGSPTYAGDLADAIMKMLPFIPGFGGVRIYNYANEGYTHWAGFAEAIIELSGLKCTVKPVSTEAYGLSKARRPAYSLLNKDKIKNELGIVIPGWKASLKKCIENMNNNK